MNIVEDRLSLRKINTLLFVHHSETLLMSTPVPPTYVPAHEHLVLIPLATSEGFMNLVSPQSHQSLFLVKNYNVWK